MQEITFYEQYEWNTDRNAMKFWAVVDGDPIICWAGEEFLTTFAQDDDEKNPQAYFMEHQDQIHEMARRMILDKRFEEDSSIIISAEKREADQLDS